MKYIYKYRLSIFEKQTLLLPKNAQILSAGSFDGINVWAYVDPTEEKEARTFRVIEDNRPYRDLDEWVFVNTVIIEDDVWHIFVDRKD